MENADAVVAAEAIRQAACRYCRGVDRLDLELMQSAYHPDATDDHGIFVGNAHEFCAFAIDRHGQKDTATMHCILNHAIEIDDADHARGEVYNVTYRIRSADGGGEEMHTAWGRYVDRYERRGGTWAISHRLWIHEFSQMGTLERSTGTNFAAMHQGYDDRGGGRAELGPGAFGR